MVMSLGLYLITLVDYEDVLCTEWFSQVYLAFDFSYSGLSLNGTRVEVESPVMRLFQ